MDIISTYQQVASYRGTAAICGTTPKTVRRVIARAEAGGTVSPRVRRVRNYESVAGLGAGDDPPDGLGGRAADRGRSPIRPDLLIGADDVHTVPRRLQWSSPGSDGDWLDTATVAARGAPLKSARDRMDIIS